VAIRREDIYKLIDKVPDEKLSELAKIIKVLTKSEDEPTEEEIEAKVQANKEYENGETYSYTIEELRKEYLDNE
jgi:hypothetical protein